MHIVILPALNEAENLKALIPTTALSLSKLGAKFEIVVVDDGSTDETATVASDFGNDWPIRVIRHEQNLGLGRALATAFSQISRRCSPDDVILSLDADGTHSPEMFGPLIAKLDEAENDASVKAVLIRVNSPGGTVAASQEISMVLEDFSKPVVVSISDVGASGAYMIAAKTDLIVATPTSAVGSIGVISQIPNISGLLEKLGIETGKGLAS